MEQSFAKLIAQVRSPLILLPTNPHLDNVAAGLSLYLALKEDKAPAISCATPMLVEHNRLVGVDAVGQDTGNKNLVIRFANYQATEIERVSYDIENQEFKLTVIPKPQVSPPRKDQVELSYSGLSSDLVVLVGGTDKAHFPALGKEDFTGGKVVHIGIRHLEDSENLLHLAFVKLASSISELMFSLLKESGYKLREDIATNLLLGIEEGSNNFTSEGVTAETFEMVAELIRKGGRRTPKDAFALKKKFFPPGAIPETSFQVKKDEPPRSWLEPKIYKGTSIS